MSSLEEDSNSYWSFEESDEEVSTENEKKKKNLKDVSRSKKFYFIKKVTEGRENVELEDMFVERSGEGEKEEDEETVLNETWCEESEEKVVRVVEAVVRKKSNSKFTLSVNEEGSSDECDSEGETGVGRFLEARDSLEIIRRSDSTGEADHLDMCKSGDSSCQSSVQREAGFEGLSYVQVTNCLNTLVNQIVEKEFSFYRLPSQDSDHALDKASKRVLFRETSDQCINPSENSISSPSKVSQKKVCFNDLKREVSNSSSFKSVEDYSLKSIPDEKPSHKKVSFHELIVISDFQGDITTERVSFDKIDRNSETNSSDVYRSDSADYSTVEVLTKVHKPVELSKISIGFREISQEENNTTVEKQDFPINEFQINEQTEQSNLHSGSEVNTYTKHVHEFNQENINDTVQEISKGKTNLNNNQGSLDITDLEHERNEFIKNLILDLVYQIVEDTEVEEKTNAWERMGSGGDSETKCTRSDHEENSGGIWNFRKLMDTMPCTMTPRLVARETPFLMSPGVKFHNAGYYLDTEDEDDCYLTPTDSEENLI